MTNETNIDNRTDDARKLDAALMGLLQENSWLNEVSTEEQRADRKANIDFLSELVVDGLSTEFGVDFPSAIYAYGLNRIKSGEPAAKVVEALVSADHRAEYWETLNAVHTADEKLQNDHNRDVRSIDDLAFMALGGPIEREAIRNAVASARGMIAADGTRTTDNESPMFEKRLRERIRTASGWKEIKSPKTTTRKLARHSAIGLNVFVQLLGKEGGTK